MIYPDVSADEWAKKWGLKIIESKAYPCGCLLRADRPFRDKDYVGLEARKCCDNAQSTCMCARAVSRKEIAEWDAALGGFV